MQAATKRLSSDLPAYGLGYDSTDDERTINWIEKLEEEKITV